jgi:phosphoglycolate phosphatase-like HAD superfamily hydrolase
MRPNAVGPPLAVFDIDGVLADVRHRLHHLEQRPKDWGGFFADLADDPPLPDGLRLAGELATNHDLAYFTGRPEWTRAATQRWLLRHGLPAGPLFMRSWTDRRPARFVKPALLRRLAGDRKVAIVVDDDRQVCDALIRDGWPVQRADWLPTTATLDAAQERDGRT